MEIENLIWQKILDIYAYLERSKFINERSIYLLKLKINELEKFAVEHYGAATADYLKLFVIFYCDEFIINKFSHEYDYAAFEKLQQSILNISNGGEQFYILLDRALSSHCEKIVYRTGLISLRRNFRGRWGNDKFAILDYIIKLEDKLGGQELRQLPVLYDRSVNKREGKIVNLLNKLSWQRGLITAISIYLLGGAGFYKLFA